MSIAGMGPRARAARRVGRTRIRNFRLRVLAIILGLTLGGIVLALTALPTFIIVYGGMLPSMVAFLVDERPGRYLFRTVGVTNAAGVIPFLADSLHYGSNAGMIVSPVGAIDTWLTIYGAAIAGWVLVISVPILWQMGFEMVLEMRIRRHQTAREAIAQDWDLEEPDA